MSTKATITFRCTSCGCLSPGSIAIPDVPPNDKHPVHLRHICFHCDAPLLRVFRNVADLIDAASENDNARGRKAHK